MITHKVLRPWLYLMTFQEFSARMIGIGQTQPYREISICRIRSAGIKKEQPAQKVLKKLGK